MQKSMKVKRPKPPSTSKPKKHYPWLYGWQLTLYPVFTGKALIYTKSRERVAQLLDEALRGDNVLLVHRLQWLGVVL